VNGRGRLAVLKWARSVTGDDFEGAI